MLHWHMCLGCDALDEQHFHTHATLVHQKRLGFWKDDGLAAREGSAKGICLSVRTISPVTLILVDLRCHDGFRCALDGSLVQIPKTLNHSASAYVASIAGSLCSKILLAFCYWQHFRITIMLAYESAHVFWTPQGRLHLKACPRLELPK